MRDSETSVIDLFDPTFLEATVPFPVNPSVSPATKFEITRSELSAVVVPS